MLPAYRDDDAAPRLQLVHQRLRDLARERERERGGAKATPVSSPTSCTRPALDAMAQSSRSKLWMTFEREPGVSYGVKLQLCVQLRARNLSDHLLVNNQGALCVPCLAEAMP